MVNGLREFTQQKWDLKKSNLHNSFLVPFQFKNVVTYKETVPCYLINLSLRTKIEFARIKSPSWRSKDFLNVKEQKIERVLSVKATKREKEIKCCLFSPGCGCFLKFFKDKKSLCEKGNFDSGIWKLLDLICLGLHFLKCYRST